MKKKLMMLLACLFFGLSVAIAQTQKITGVVISEEDGEPIIGASVFVKGHNTIGTITDVDGNFTLTGVPASAKFLTVSYVGFATQDVAIKPILKIILKSDSQLIDDVVVVAFGKAKKSSLSGSVAQVGSKELSQRQVSNVTQALAGKTPGITVSSNNNQPGQSANITIRGIGSFSAGRGPLYVVDGVPYDGDISAINPQDIESMSILKDASSAALYGARGANGVIMVQTKSGEKGASKMVVSVDARFGFNQRGVKDYETIKDPKAYAAKYFEGIYNSVLLKNDLKKLTPDQLTAAHAAALTAAKKTYFATTGGTANLVYPMFTFPTTGEPFIRQANGSFIMNPEATVGALYRDAYWLQPDDWTNEVFKTNPRQEYNVSISGNNDKANYYMSAGYLNDKGYIIKSGFERFTSRLRVDFRPTTWMHAGANLGFTHYTSNTLANTTEGGNSGNIFGITSFIAPIYPIYVRDKDGNIMVDKFGNTIFDYGSGEYPGLKRPYMSIANPLGNYTHDKREYVADIVSAKGYVNFNIIEGLKLTLNAGYDVDNTYSTRLGNAFYGQFSQSGGTLTKQYSKSHAINLQQLLTYAKSFGDHNFDFLLGHEYYKSISETLWGRKEKLYNPYDVELDNAILAPATGSSSSHYATEGYLGRIQYDYKNKYFVQASFRRDASSRFHKDNRWGNFWSVGASWLLHQEKFMEPLKDIISQLKFKVSYGMQGNDNIGSFRYTDLYIMENSNDNFSVAFNAKGNKNLTWESSGNFNVGVEVGFFKDRIRAEIDLYSRKVTDMLFFKTVSQTNGYGGYYDNIGSMKNVGIDFLIDGVILKKKNIEWTASVNGGYFKNTLTKLPDEWNAVEGGYRDGTSIYVEGGSIYDMMLPKYLGVNEVGKPTWQTYNATTGEYGSTTEYTVAQEKANRVLITDVRPHLQGGISTNLNLYGFDFAMGFSYALGGRIYDSTYANLMHGGRGPDAGTTWHTDIFNSWTPENTATDVPAVNYSGMYANSTSTRFLVSRSYLALNNLTVGYRFTSKTLAPLGLNSARLYVVADNLALLSARKGLDPRFGSGVGYKAIRTFSAGVQLTF